MYTGLFKGQAGVPAKALVWPDQFPVLPQTTHTVTECFKLTEREKARMNAAVKDCASQAKPESKAVPLASTPLFASPLAAALKESKRVLLSGAGGGYDVFAGLPLYWSLKQAGCEVFLANLTFTSPHVVFNTTGKSWGSGKTAQICVEVTADTKPKFGSWDDDYWPEHQLSCWFRKEMKEEVAVYTILPTGVKSLIDVYVQLQKHLNFDTVILVDGGTDSLMFGDEAELGTPCEDALSLAAVNALPASLVPHKLLLCTGIGIDTFHGVCHARYFENVAAVARQGGFLGSFSLLREMPEAAKAYAAFIACTPGNSIVSSSLLNAMDHQFGNVHSSYSAERTKGSALFINPLMNIVWCFELAPVCALNLFMPSMMETTAYEQLAACIREFRRTHPPTRPHMFLPI